MMHQAIDSRPALPSIIIAPPLTGCSTLASQLGPTRSLIVDCDRVSGFATRGRTLSERKIMFHEMLTHSGAGLVCLPVLPSPEVAWAVTAVVIIPAPTFIKRLGAISESRSEGHKVAALQWRDDAIKLSVHLQIPVFQYLNQVPALADVLQSSSPDIPLFYPQRSHGGR